VYDARGCVIIGDLAPMIKEKERPTFTGAEQPPGGVGKPVEKRHGITSRSRHRCAGRRAC